MVKFLLAALSVFTLQAQANDGSIAVVEVLGVAPGAANGSAVSVYGGNTKHLYDVMPVTAIPQIKWKSLYFASPGYAASINCHEEYVRPSNGETRFDYMCTFAIDSRENSGVDWEDNNPWNPDWSDFSAFSGSSAISVLGVAPGPVTGQMFAFYGGDAERLAANLPAKVTFSSPKYRVTLACQQNYKRPTTGEWRSDYMCSLNVKPR